LLQGAQNLLKQEKKRRDGVERQLKKAVEERSEMLVRYTILIDNVEALDGLEFTICSSISSHH
jgi:hypothetical protein